MSLDQILLIIAAVCFVLVALNLDFTNGKISFLGLGLLAWVLTGLL